MKRIDELIEELNENFNDLGQDLVIFESILQATREKNVFPQELIASCLHRMKEDINQHAGDIKLLTGYLISDATTVC